VISRYQSLRQRSDFLRYADSGGGAI
jgi:hypothetical protein